MQDELQHILNYRPTRIGCISLDATISQAALQMQKQQVSSLVVVDRNRAVGIVSEHDIVVGVLACEKNPAIIRVSSIMAWMPIVAPATSIYSSDDTPVRMGRREVLRPRGLDGEIVGRLAHPRAQLEALEVEELVRVELACTYCGEPHYQSNWDLGVAVCRKCFARTQSAWSPYNK